MLLDWKFDDSPDLPDDEGSNQPLLTVARDGWFVREQETAFQFYFYWDSLEEMQAYVAECWAPSVSSPAIVIGAAKQLANQKDARVGGLMTMIVSRWKRLM